MLIPLIYKDKVIGGLNVQSTQPGIYTERDLKVAERVAQQIAGAISNAQLFNERKRVEEALRRSEETAMRMAIENALIAEMGSIISSTLNIEEVYQQFAEKARKLIPFDRVVINLLHSEDEHLWVTYVNGVEVPGRHKNESYPLKGSLFERMRQTQSGWIVQSEDPRETDDEFSPFAPSLQVGLRSFLSIPLISGNQVPGALYFQDRKPMAYQEQHLRLAERIAAHISGAVANAQLFFERKRAEAEVRKLLRSVEEKRKELRALTIRLQDVEEAERRRLAQELHDRVGQNFAALSINLNIIQRELSAESSGKVEARLEDSLKLLEETALHIRDVMAELRPPVLDDYGLLAALQWYGEQFTKRTGVSSVIQGAEATPRLPLRLEAALFRITQEALTNVARHARARQVTMTLEELAQEVRLTIADDGTGFDFSFQSETGSAWGLISMRERAEAVGGRFQVRSAPGEGTRIMVGVRK